MESSLRSLNRSAAAERSARQMAEAAYEKNHSGISFQRAVYVLGRVMARVARIAFAVIPVFLAFVAYLEMPSILARPLAALTLGEILLWVFFGSASFGMTVLAFLVGFGDEPSREREIEELMELVLRETERRQLRAAYKRKLNKLRAWVADLGRPIGG